MLETLSKSSPNQESLPISTSSAISALILVTELDFDTASKYSGAASVYYIFDMRHLCINFDTGPVEYVNCLLTVIRIHYQ